MNHHAEDSSMKPHKPAASGLPDGVVSDRTRLANPGTIDALRKQIMEDPAFRKAYVESRTSFQAAKAS